MTGGAEMSERERVRGRGWAGLLGRATRASARARLLGRAVGPSQREKEESARVEFLFLFFKNVNSNSICLFHLKFSRAPKLVKNFV
jgi:hypothetical protein